MDWYSRKWKDECLGGWIDYGDIGGWGVEDGC